MRSAVLTKVVRPNRDYTGFVDTFFRRGPTPIAANDVLDAVEIIARAAEPVVPVARPLSRFIPYLGVALTAYELWKWINEQDVQGSVVVAPGNWRLAGTCGYPAPTGPVVATQWHAQSNCSRTLNSTIPAAATPGRFSTSAVIRTVALDAEAVPNYRVTTVSRWTRTVTDAANWPVRYYAPYAVPGFGVQPVNVPRVQEVPSAFPPEFPTEQPSNESEPDGEPLQGLNSSIEFSVGTSEATNPRPRERTNPRQNPRERSPRTERKVRSKTTRFAVALWHYMDKLSEASEVVDAFFAALPPEVQKKWEKKNERNWFGDQFGQYGIGGADWKLQALYYNWEKVDLIDALGNVGYNMLEDKVVGNIMKRLPKTNAPITDPLLEAYGSVSNDWRQAFKDYTIGPR